MFSSLFLSAIRKKAMAPANSPAEGQDIIRASNRQRGAMRAGASTQEAYVLFVNTTERKLHLYWIDHHGRQQIQLLLKPGESAKVNTYRSHPWVFRDSNTGERMQVAHQNSFWPEPYFMPNPNNLDQWIKCRKQILIHFPVRSLRENLLWHVALKYADLKESKRSERIEKLYLPGTVKADLKLKARYIEDHRYGRLTAES